MTRPVSRPTPAAARTEVPIGRPMLERILSLAGQHMILVGGQALSFWVSYYGLPEPVSAITKDADFLGTPADVRRLATGLGGHAHFARKIADRDHGSGD